MNKRRAGVEIELRHTYDNKSPNALYKLTNESSRPIGRSLALLGGNRTLPRNCPAIATLPVALSTATAVA